MPLSLPLPKLILGIMLFFVVAQAYTQDSLIILKYPSEKELNVTARASVTKINESFIFRYTLLSSSSSSQKAWEYSLFDVSGFDSLKSATGWDVGTSVIPKRRVTWASSDSAYDVLPGKSLVGFSVISRGLPSIKDFYVRGYIDVPAISVEPDSIFSGLFPDNSFHGTTLGPTASPIPFRPLYFIDSLISYVSRSRSLSWITSQQTADNYLHYFMRVRSQLQAGRESEAIGNLQVVLKNSEADSSSLLTSEAYALIRYNTEHLIRRLHGSKE